MANLSQYIDFSLVIRKGQLKLELVDPNNYPAGVAETLTGYFVITQPDGLSETGSFVSPQVYWDAGNLVEPLIDLRLRTDGKLQPGTYTITYNVRATGYDDTALTKVFVLSYEVPRAIITGNMNVFVPSLKVIDATVYTATGWTLQSVDRQWTAAIDSVEGTEEELTASTPDFDLLFGGEYYDAHYDIELVTSPLYTSVDYPWVQLLYELEAEGEYDAYAPLDIDGILERLADMKLTIDGCVCGNNCCGGTGDCSYEKAQFTLAMSIYNLMVERGRKGTDYSGLEKYIQQLMKLTNNCTNPTQDHTNEPIEAYDWGGYIPGQVEWDDVLNKPESSYIQFKVGDPGYPAAGDTSWTDARFAGKKLSQFVLFRNPQVQYHGNPSNGDTYINKIDDATDTITVNEAFGTGEVIQLLIVLR
jgi:hypothetical protein